VKKIIGIVGDQNDAQSAGMGSDFRSVQRKLPCIQVRERILYALKLAKGFEKPFPTDGLQNEVISFPAKKHFTAFHLKFPWNSNGLVGPVAKYTCQSITGIF